MESKTITKDNSFIYVCIYTVEIHCIHCKGIKMIKNLKIICYRIEGLKNVYIKACESESDI